MKRLAFIILSLLLWVRPASAAFVNAWGNSGTTASITVSTSTGNQIQAGDILVANIGWTPQTQTCNAPTGGAGSTWSTAVASFGANNSAECVKYVVAQAADIGATFTFTTSGSGTFVAAVITALRGRNTTTPLDVAGVGSTGSASGSNTVTAASITLLLSGDDLLWAGSMNSISITAPGAPFTTAFNVAQSPGVGNDVSYHANVSSGATGTVSGTAASGTFAAVLVGIAPATATPTPTPGMARNCLYGRDHYGFMGGCDVPSTGSMQ